MGSFFNTAKVVNLADLFVTREECNRAMRNAHKKIGKCVGGIFALSMLTGFLFAAVTEQNKRIDDLEKRLNKKDETAG